MLFNNRIRLSSGLQHYLNLQFPVPIPFSDESISLHYIFKVHNDRIHPPQDASRLHQITKSSNLAAKRIMINIAGAVALERLVRLYRIDPFKLLGLSDGFVQYFESNEATITSSPVVHLGPRTTSMLFMTEVPRSK